MCVCVCVCVCVACARACVLVRVRALAAGIAVLTHASLGYISHGANSGPFFGERADRHMVEGFTCGVYDNISHTCTQTC
jgi:hypothetical protein